MGPFPHASAIRFRHLGLPASVALGLLGLLTPCLLALGLLLQAGVALGQSSPVPAGPPPAVERARHSVPLDKVVFDTFDGGSLPLSRADAATIERLRDAIRPIYRPRYEGPAGGAWLRPGDLVIGVAGRERAYAYPLKMLNFHEIVNDVIDGVPVLISYCPLCASGVVFDRRLDGRTLVFGNTSALYENDMVMYDHQTGSYWFQVAGRAIVGALTERKLPVLPSLTLPWGSWRRMYPHTRVLSREQGFARRPPYERDAFRGYAESVDALRFPFPVSVEALDRRLRAGAVVLAVRAGGQEKAYPLERLGDGAVNDAVGGMPVVVFSRADGPWGGAFLRQVRGRLLRFRLRQGRIEDEQTGSLWSPAGKALAGPLAGTRLRPLPTRRAFWFSLSLALPGIALYAP